MEEIKGNLSEEGKPNRHRGSSLDSFLEEEGVPVNVAGSGHIAGIGIGPQGEPGVHKKKKRKVDLGLLRRWTKGVK